MVVWAAGRLSTVTRLRLRPTELPLSSPPWQPRGAASGCAKEHQQIRKVTIVCACAEWVARTGLERRRGTGAVWREPPAACSSAVGPTPQTWGLGHILTPKTWAPHSGTVLRVLFAGKTVSNEIYVRLEERELFQKLRSPLPTHTSFSGLRQ